MDAVCPRRLEYSNIGYAASMLLTVPLIEAVTWRHLASDVDRHGLAFPVLNQLLLAKTSIHELFDEFVAAEVEKLHVRLHPAIEWQGDPQRPRKDLRIFDRHFVPNDVRRHRREALHQVQRVAMEVPGAVEPTPLVEIRHVDDEGVSVPTSD